MNPIDNNLGTRIIIDLLEVVAAVVVIISAGAENLSRMEPKQVQE